MLPRPRCPTKPSCFTTEGSVRQTLSHQMYELFAGRGHRSEDVVELAQSAEQLAVAALPIRRQPRHLGLAHVHPWDGAHRGDPFQVRLGSEVAGEEPWIGPGLVHA